jgi:hypothetical protein
MDIDDTLDDLFGGDNNGLKDEKVKILNSLNSEEDIEVEVASPKTNTKQDKKTTKPKKELIGVSPRSDLGDEVDTSYRNQPKNNDVVEDDDDDLDDILGLDKPDFGLPKKEDESYSVMDGFDDVEAEDDLVDESEIINEEVEETEAEEPESSVQEDDIETDEEIVVEEPDSLAQKEEQHNEKEVLKVNNKKSKTSFEQRLLDLELIDDISYLQDSDLRKFYKIKLDAAEFFKLNSEKIDYIACMKEVSSILGEVKIHHEDAIHLDKFNESIQNLQGFRNRVAEMKAWAIGDYFLKKKYIKDLENYLTSCSKKKSKEQREGDQLEHMRDLKEEFILAERFYQHVDWCFDALTAAHESLSRRITIEQEKHKRISRGEEPYVSPTGDVEDNLPRRKPLFKQNFEEKGNKNGWTSWDDVAN